MAQTTRMRRVIAAADVGGTSIKLALVQGSSFLAKISIPAKAEAGLELALGRILEAWKQLCQNAGISFQKLDAFGISFPGIIDVATGRIWITPAGKFEDSRNMDLQAWAKLHLERPLALCNDAKAALLGECKLGAARGVRNAAMLTLGTGVGTAVLVNGSLLNGPHGLAGNAAGHVTINMRGEECLCGNMGCVESEASSWALQRKAFFHPRISTSLLAKAKEVDYKALFEAAAKGDEVALELQEHSLRAWSIAAVNMVNNFDPETIIIGGGVAASAGVIIPHISEYVRKRAWAQWVVPVVAAQLGNDAGLFGIASLAEEFL